MFHLKKLIHRHFRILVKDHLFECRNSMYHIFLKYKRLIEILFEHQTILKFIIIVEMFIT